MSENTDRHAWDVAAPPSLLQTPQTFAIVLGVMKLQTACAEQQSPLNILQDAS
ncbi:MAG: hypothetical protein AAF329_08250 [Cyanobacteria bacterium P01_A01_bin.17]